MNAIISFYKGVAYMECRLRLFGLAELIQLQKCNKTRHPHQLTFESDRRSSRPARTIAGTSHVYAFSRQLVASRFPSSEKDTHSTGSAAHLSDERMGWPFSRFPSAENDTQFTCSTWSSEPIGRPLSRFHNRTVLSDYAPARMRSFGDIPMA